MKLFYTNYVTDKGIDSENPIEAEVDYAIKTFLELLDEIDSFIGLIDENGKCIQFVNEEKQWLLDIPNPPNFENQQAYLNDKECLSLIEEIITNNKINPNMNLYNVKIMNETLEDVLNRKK